MRTNLAMRPAVRPPLTGVYRIALPSSARRFTELLVEAHEWMRSHGIPHRRVPLDSLVIIGGARVSIDVHLGGDWAVERAMILHPDAGPARDAGEKIVARGRITVPLIRTMSMPRVFKLETDPNARTGGAHT